MLITWLSNGNFSGPPPKCVFWPSCGRSPPLPKLQGCARGLWAGTRCLATADSVGSAGSFESKAKIAITQPINEQIPSNLVGLLKEITAILMVSSDF